MFIKVPSNLSRSAVLSRDVGGKVKNVLCVCAAFNSECWKHPYIHPNEVIASLSAGGCRRGPSPVGSPPSLALLAVEAEAPPGPPPSSIPQCRLLTFSPLRIPVLGSPFPGKVVWVGVKKKHRVLCSTDSLCAFCCCALVAASTQLLCEHTHLGLNCFLWYCLKVFSDSMC